MEPTTIELLEKLNAFYSSSFQQLVNYTFALLAFVGAGIPLVLAILQQRSFKIESQAVKKELAEHANQIRRELKAESEAIAKEMKESLTAELKKEITDLESRTKSLISQTEAQINKKLAGADGGTYQIQGLMDATRKMHAHAAESFTCAAERYLLAEDELNLGRVLNGVKSALPLVNKKDFEDVPEMQEGVESLIKALDANNVNGRYSDVMRELRQELDKAEKREPKTAKSDLADK